MENTYPNWLVPIEIAKNLKKIGFDEPCLITNYSCNDDIETNFISFNYESCSDVNVDILECKFKRNPDFKDTHKKYPINIITVPTWEQVFKWFRDKGFMITLINHKNKSKFNFYNEKINNGTHCTGIFKTYEEARTGVVTELIKIYKENI